MSTFRFSLTILSEPVAWSGLPLTSADGVFVAPDQLRAEVGGYYPGVPPLDSSRTGARHTTNLVAIGEQVWRAERLTGVSAPIGVWSLVPVSKTPLAFLNPHAGVQDLLEGVTEPVVIGSNFVVDGVRVRRVKGRAPAADVARLVGAAQPRGEVSVTLWIGDRDKLLRRVDVRGRVGRGEDLDTARTLRLSDFDRPFKIEPPLFAHAAEPDRQRPS